MSTQLTISAPKGIDIEYQWGPKLFPGGKLYIFKGEQKLVPTSWKDAEWMMKQLKELEIFEFNNMLPEQRKELFERKLAVLTKDLPPDWAIIGCTVASGIILAIIVFSKVKPMLSKL